MWALYEAGKLNADVELTGHFVESEISADVDSVLREIEAVRVEEMRRQAARVAGEDEI
jgi:RIO kinase 1